MIKKMAVKAAVNSAVYLFLFLNVSFGNIDTIGIKRFGPLPCLDAVRFNDSCFYLIGNISLEQGTRYRSIIKLIKTDINGDSLWSKTYGDSSEYFSEAWLINAPDNKLLIVSNKYLNKTAEYIICFSFFDTSGNLISEKKIPSISDIVEPVLLKNGRYALLRKICTSITSHATNYRPVLSLHDSAGNQLSELRYRDSVENTTPYSLLELDNHQYLATGMHNYSLWLWKVDTSGKVLLDSVYYSGRGVPGNTSIGTKMIQVSNNEVIILGLSKGPYYRGNLLVINSTLDGSIKTAQELKATIPYEDFRIRTIVRLSNKGYLAIGNQSPLSIFRFDLNFDTLYTRYFGENSPYFWGTNVFPMGSDEYYIAGTTQINLVNDCCIIKLKENMNHAMRNKTNRELYSLKKYYPIIRTMKIFINDNDKIFNLQGRKINALIKSKNKFSFIY